MNTGPVKSWTDRLLEFAVTLVAVGLLLNWAWGLIRPLVPVIAVGAGIVAVRSYIVRRKQSW